MGFVLIRFRRIRRRTTNRSLKRELFIIFEREIIMRIELNDAETLVLYDWLKRISEDDEYFQDISEQEVLWTIEAQMDKVLVEPFKPNYVEIIAEARKQVRNNY